MLPTTEAPFPSYFDFDGDPLDSGYIYYGLINQNPVTAPLPIFWDAAGTQPASQPIRTSDGNTVRSGAPANVYVNSAYSISVYDKRMRLIYTLPDSSEYSAKFYKAPGLGAVSRPITSKFGDTVSVKDYGALGNGVADDTSAINAAITANPGQTIHFPAGNYKVSSSILLNQAGTKLQGDAFWGVQITCTTPSAPIINISGGFCSVDGISCIYSGTPVAGASTFYVNAQAVSLTNIAARNGYNGIEVTTLGAALVVDNFDLLDYVASGVLLTDVNDAFLNNFVVNAGTLTRGILGGFRLYGNCQAIVVSNGDVLGGVYGMTTDSAAYVYNQRPSYNKFTNVYFDSTNNGISLTNTVGTTYDSCWFASTKNSFGMQMTNCDTVVFQKCQIFNNWQHGAVISGGCSRIMFDSCQVFSNGQQTVNTFDGIVIAANISDFRVQGCIIGNQLGFNVMQRNGVTVTAGASDRYIIADNLVFNNLGTAIGDGGTGVNKRVANNY